MIDTQFDPSDGTVADREHEVVQQYVQALLARQHALDLLETIHQQIDQVWVVMRKLLDGTGIPFRAAKAVRAARAAQAAQAQSSYRSLEKRREECSAALHQAERTANAALKIMLAVRSKPASWKNTGFLLSSRAQTDVRLICRPARRKSRKTLSGRC